MKIKILYDFLFAFKFLRTSFVQKTKFLSLISKLLLNQKANMRTNL